LSILAALATSHRAAAGQVAGRILLAALAAFLSCAASAARAAMIVVPNALATTEGDAFAHTAPFNTELTPNRYMQIYASSQFAASPGPLLITEITFRPDGSQLTPFSTTFPNVQIFLSTTSQSVAGLSSTFAANVGPDNTLVRTGPLTVATSDQPGPGSAKQFDIAIPLTTPFLYDPGAGNLLLDIRNFNAGTTGFIDAASDPSGTTTRLVFFDGSATEATGIVQPFGIVTQFTTQAVPAPSTLRLLAVGTFGLLGCGWRRRRTGGREVIA
jgi:hypothetical protein